MTDETALVQSTKFVPPFSSKRFAPAVGQPFVWHAFDPTGAEVSIDMTLVEVAVRRSPAPFEQFSLLFAGPADVALEQGTYTISNDLTGTEALFATPVGPDSSGRRQYEVCVSRELEAWEQDAAATAHA